MFDHIVKIDDEADDEKYASSPKSVAQVTESVR